MYISAFLHRDELFEITNRWFSNKVEQDDALRVTRIITYDGFAAWETMLSFMRGLNRELTPVPVFEKPISIKRELKDFICFSNGPVSDRINYLKSEYKKLPEYHYIGSPMAGYIYHDADNRMVSLCRLKRVKRIAEKTSRYAALHVTEKVKRIGEKIWREGGGSPDMPDPLPLEVMIQAEKQLMHSIKTDGFSLPADIMAIRDVLGIKIIQSGETENQLESLVGHFPGVAIVEKESHAGNYNATHYILELKVDKEELISKFKSQSRNKLYGNRGLPEARIDEDFETFIRTGADTVQLDLIFTTFEELIESEIGRSMHEVRIFKQRKHQNSYGNIPINIEYLIEYMIAVGLSPVAKIDEIPIKIWGRYLPDALSYRIRNLYHMPNYSIINLQAG